MALVLSVGQCGADDYRIGRTVCAELSAETERAGSAEVARQMMAGKRYDLVLVNRVFDADGASGVEFIGAMKEAGEATPMLLVSDYADAQAAALAKGAMMGFGKSALGGAEVGERLRAATGPKDQT